MTLRRVGVLLLVLTATTAATAVPRFDQVKAAHRSSEQQVVDRQGEVVQSLRIDLQVRRAAWLPLERFSPALRDAVVQAEDKRFWSHGGVDWAAVARSAMANAQGEGAVQGASTLTMQLAALLDADLARPSGGRSVAQKLAQIAVARELESGWRKAQILEAYLNRVPLRGELVGV
ncbi:MAG: transglycosylase domain-containing protein, partial [Burkholderiales bacterium]|nr:transglycosylase domain-containing protein [Burkholderiales bacterium]